MFGRKTKEKQSKKELINGLVFIHPENGGGFELKEKNADLVKPPLRAIRWKKSFLNSNVPLYLFYEDKQPDGTFVIKPFDWESQLPVTVQINDEANKPTTIKLTPFVVFDLNDWSCRKDFIEGGEGKIQEMLKTGALVVMACVCLFVTYLIAAELNKPAPGVPTQVTTTPYTGGN